MSFLPLKDAFNESMQRCARNKQGLVLYTPRREVERLPENQVASIHLMDDGPVVRSGVSGAGWYVEMPVSAGGMME